MMAAHDILLLDLSGDFTDALGGERMVGITTSSRPAGRLEAVANKVVKFLLTSKGSDAFSPDYGGTAFRTQQISKAYLPRFYLELQQDVLRALKFVQGTESGMASGTERLSAITIKQVRYDEVNTPDRLDVYLVLTTTKGNNALLALSKGTK